MKNFAVRALNYAFSRSRPLFLSIVRWHYVLATSNVTAAADPTLLLLCSFLFDICFFFFFFHSFVHSPSSKNSFHLVRTDISILSLIFHDFYANFLMVLESAVTITAVVLVMVELAVYISIFIFQRQPYIFVFLCVNFVWHFHHGMDFLALSLSLVMPFSSENISCHYVYVRMCVFFLPFFICIHVVLLLDCNFFFL